MVRATLAAFAGVAELAGWLCAGSNDVLQIRAINEKKVFTGAPTAKFWEL